MIENYQRIVFGRNDETRAKQNTVYRLTVYDVNLCIYSSKTVGENFVIRQMSTVKLLQKSG